MLKPQIFKTLAGAQKRAAFERAHSPYRWSEVRCTPDGQPDPNPYTAGQAYVWRLERTRK